MILRACGAEQQAYCATVPAGGQASFGFQATPGAGGTAATSLVIDGAAVPPPPPPPPVLPTISVGDARVHLTTKEYQILELLTLRKGTTVTKEMFFNHLYGGIDEPEFKIIDVFICKLRKKLASAASGHHNIENVWGRGYVLCDPVEGAVAA